MANVVYKVLPECVGTIQRADYISDMEQVLLTSVLLSFSFDPFIGWLADVRFGRYEVIKFDSIVSFLASILYYFAMFAGESVSTLSTVLYYIAICYS